MLNSGKLKINKKHTINGSWYMSDVNVIFSDGKVAIRGYVNDKYPGIAIHKKVQNIKGKLESEKRGCWTLTHIKSGRRICWTPLKSFTFKQFLKEIKPILHINYEEEDLQYLKGNIKNDYYKINEKKISSTITNYL